MGARTSDEYADAFASLLPTGPAWPREPESELQIVIAGMAEIWGTPPNNPNSPLQISVDGRAADLLTVETFPDTTTELLPEWQTAYGLPDACLAEPLTIEARRDATPQSLYAARQRRAGVLRPTGGRHRIRNRDRRTFPVYVRDQRGGRHAPFQIQMP